jgi:hypothetical protein
VDGEDAAVADTVIIDAVCPPTTLEEAQAALADTRSPLPMVRLSFDAEASGMDGDDAAVGATGHAHDAQPQQPSVGASDVAHVGQPDQPTNGGPSPPSVVDFIASLTLPLEVPLIQSPPRLRVSRVRDEDLVLRRSERLAAKSVFRDPNPEKQAKRVLLRKWQPSASTPRSAPLTPDATVAARFHEAFREPLSSSKRQAIQELYPMLGARGRRRLRLD